MHFSAICTVLVESYCRNRILILGKEPWNPKIPGLVWWIAILQNVGCSTLGLFLADPLGTDAAGVVLHLPVQDIQLNGGNPGAAHVAVGIGNEAAIFRSIACCRHLHPQGVGGGVAAGQVLEVIGSRSAAQPLITQVCAFRFNNEGCGIADLTIVFVQLLIGTSQIVPAYTMI